jgi:hypothetical protein
LASGAEVLYIEEADNLETTTSRVTVSGTLPDGRLCLAQDEVTVVVDRCKVDGGEVKIKDNKLEWKITNSGPSDIFIERIEITWPDANGGIKKIKRDGDELYKQLLAPTSAMIDSGWKDPKPDKRRIKDGETDTLKFEFERDADTDAGKYTVVVEFDNGCVIVF